MTLQGMIARAYPSPEWAVFYEVSNATGFGARRRADAVALGIWPSRGHHLAGFEFKEERRDWLREKANPEKAESVASHCDTWWLVAGREGVIHVDEVPQPWGLYVATADRSKLLTVKKPEFFEGRDKRMIRRTFVASMLRKVTETTVPRVELQRLVDEAVKVAVERTREGHQVKHLSAEVERLSGILDTFKSATGVDLAHGWRGPEKIAAAVQAVLDLDGDKRNLEHAQRCLANASKTVADALAAWPIPYNGNANGK